MNNKKYGSVNKILIHTFLLSQICCENGIRLSTNNYNKSSSICILEITKQYFSNTPQINIYTSTFKDNEQLFLLLETNFMKRIRNFTTFNVDFEEARKNRQYSIIILNNLEELLLQEKQIIKLCLWNARSKYLFVVRTNSILNLNTAVELLWDSFIINAVIMMPSRMYPDKMELYSWFPYENGLCGKEIKPRLIDTCKYGQFTKNINLYPSKLPEYFNGCPVRAHVIIWSPFVMPPEDGVIQEEKVLQINNGVDIKMMKAIANIANFTLLTYSSPIPNNWGLATIDGNTTGVIKILVEKKADIGFGAYGPTVERRMYCDYSASHNFESMTFCVPKAQHIPKWKQLLQTFKVDTWISMLTVYIIVSIVIWGLCNCQPKDPTPFVLVQNNFQYIFSVALGIAVYQTPRKISGRILFFGWVVFGFHFVTAYQAKLISVLLHPGHERQMSTLDELLMSDVPWQSLPTLKRFFANMDDWRVRKIVEEWKACPDANACLYRIAYKRNFALCTLESHARYEMYKYTDENLESLIHCFPSYLKYPSEIYMTKGFPLRDRMNKLIYRIKSTGLMPKWERDMKHYLRLKYRYMFKGSTGKQLKMFHLQGVFFILSLGLGIATMCFICEIVYVKMFNHYNS